MIAVPWSKDDPLLFNGKTQGGHFPRTRDFDRLVDTDWAELAPYLPDWNQLTRGMETAPAGYTQQPEKDQKESDREIVYRVRRIPECYKGSGVLRLLSKALLIENEKSIRVWSLAESPYRSEKIATVTFDQIPATLTKSSIRDKDEWHFEARESFDKANDVTKISPIQMPPILDTHFRGFTPLHLAEAPEFEYNAEWAPHTLFMRR